MSAQLPLRGARATNQTMRQQNDTRQRHRAQNTINNIEPKRQRTTCAYVVNLMPGAKLQQA